MLKTQIVLAWSERVYYESPYKLDRDNFPVNAPNQIARPKFPAGKKLGLLQNLEKFASVLSFRNSYNGKLVRVSDRQIS